MRAGRKAFCPCPSVGQNQSMPLFGERRVVIGATGHCFQSWQAAFILVQCCCAMLPRMARPVLRGVVFDLDGTLTLPHAIDFARMKARIGVAPDADVLASIAGWEEERQREAMAIIEEEEVMALEHVQLQPGAQELVAHLDRHGLHLAILTRNGQHAVDHFAARFAHSFDTIVTREFKPCKPHPAPLLHICQQWGVRPQEVMMVGDFRDDLLCGNGAGAFTALLQVSCGHRWRRYLRRAASHCSHVQHEGNGVFAELAHFAVNSLVELQSVIDTHFAMTRGRS